MKDQVKALASKFQERVIEIRRHIHQNPELSFEEVETSKYITSILDELGIEYTSGWVKTGITGVIKGRNPEKKIVALRADIDALPILEQNDCSYKSSNEGVMHACGHDVHSACLLGTLMILNELKDEFEGTVKFIFQPGEEKLPGGASLMIKEGAMENPSAEIIFAQHVYPEMEAGKVGFKAGQYMASCDEIHARVIGKGGHGAMPHQNIDPIAITAQIITALQQIVSRNCPPAIPTVLTFGDIHGHGATNIIPGEVSLQGTFRTMNEDWRYEAHAKMQNMAEGIAESMGASCEFRIDKGYPSLINDPDATAIAKSAAIDFLGQEKVEDMDIRLTGEDFSYYSQLMPSCFFRLGTRNEKQGITAPVHNPNFNIDESAIETGIGLMSWIVLSSLK